MNIIDLWIPGEPATAGSKEYKGKTKTGRPIIADSSGAKGVSWRTSVQDAARKVHDGPPIPRGTAIAMVCVFYRARPKGHYGAKGVKPRYQDVQWVTKKDSTKMLRAAEDALSKVLYQDDSQVILAAQAKRWCDGTDHGDGARILVGPPNSFHAMLEQAGIPTAFGQEV